MTDVQANLSPAPAPLPARAPARPAASYLARTVLDVVGRTGARLGLAWIIAMAFGAIFAPLLASSHPYLLKAWNAEIGAYVWSSPMLRHLTAVDVVLLVVGCSAIGVAFARALALEQRVGVVVFALLATTPFIARAALLDAVARAANDAEARTRAALLGLAGATAAVLLLLAAVGVARRLGLRGRQWLGLGVPLGLVIVLVTVFPVRPPGNVVFDRYRVAQREGQVAFAVRAPIPYSPTDRLRDQFDPKDPHPWSPRWRSFHLMGTERNGADIASRMIHASRIALAVGFISTSIAMAIGVTVGGLMGYFSGLVDLLGMRLVEIFSAIPTFFLLLSLVAFWGRDLYLMMVIIGLTGWVGDALFTRAEFLRLRKQDFVQAAVACGLPLRSILFRHMLPNGIAPVLVSASFGVASAILYESTLSFLGLGLVDEPSWGQMLSQATGAGGAFYWWIATFPGLAIFCTVFAYNLVGEALRDAIDPHSSKASQM